MIQIVVLNDLNRDDDLDDLDRDLSFVRKGWGISP